MRHAKSSWGDPLQEDHERPLNERGRQSARAIGHWLAQKGHRPDQVLSSDSTRTRQTWAEMAASLGPDVPVRWESALYHADPQDILNMIRTAQGDTLLVLGHNPGMGLAAANMARDASRHPRFQDYPTAATTVLRLDIDDWSQADWRSGSVLEFTVPRDLGVD